MSINTLVINSDFFKMISSYMMLRVAVSACAIPAHEVRGVGTCEG